MVAVKATTPTSAAASRFDLYVIFMVLLVCYFTFTTPGGCQVPSPGGRIDGGSVFGQ